MTTLKPYKLVPGSAEAQAVELLRFLPADTALNSSELRDRLGWQTARNAHQTLAWPTKRGMLRAEKRFDEASNCLRMYWRAVRPDAGGAR